MARLSVRWAEQLQERPTCRSGCGARVWHDGRRLRSATFHAHGEIVFVPDVEERRVRCSSCRASWTHRPEGITSRAHYQPCVVSHALIELGRDPDATTTSVAEEVGCARSTVRRFAARVAAIAEPPVLVAALLEEAGEPVVPDVPREIASSQRSSRLGALMTRAVAVIVLLEALASVRGLAPPGLAHAASLIPADAPGPQIRGDPPRSA